ncbi:MAG: T9SS type A sorting domain-containing protein [Bacteroidetes bacterium]|nr:T9SS type A sorting domain-containing protein [Bacteroidota bacterium]
MGIQDMSWQQVYNFDVGDVFHYYGSWWTSLGSWYTTRTIETILGKTVYGNYDTVSYQIEKCVRIDASYPPHYTTSFDTVTKVYNLRDAPLLLPAEFTDTLKPPDYNAKISIQNSRLKKGVITGTNIYEPATSCYTNQFESMYTEDSYIFGLGHTYNYYQYWSDGLFTYSESLAYYKKGTEVWGTPLSTDCSVLTNTENKTVSQESSIDIYPNPAETAAQVFLRGFIGNDNLYFALYNFSGMQVYEGKISANPFTLNRAGRASGLYLLVISDKTGTIIGRSKVNFK